MTTTLDDFPAEWVGNASVLMAWCHEHPSGVNLSGVQLGDATCLFACDYPGGARFVRVAKHTGWAIEERYAGDPPAEGMRAFVDGLWQGFLEVIIPGARRFLR